MVRNAIIRCLLVLCAAFLLPWDAVAAGPMRCYSDTPFEGCPTGELPANDPNYLPVKETDCFGAFRCAVCNVVDTCGKASTATNWKFPKIRVVYRPGVSDITEQYRADFSIGRCTFLYGVRFCARAASAGMFGNTTSASDPGGERPQICAYEDWMDGMDTNPDYSPHHHNEKNKSGITAANGAVMGAMASTVSPFVALGPMSMALGASIGVLVGAIMEHHNHVVPTELGCVERPIATGPPVWCNECWGQKYLPLPLVDYAPDSSFFNPALKLYFCEKTVFDEESNAWKSIGRPTRCRFDPADPSKLVEGMQIIATRDVNPKPTAGNAYSTLVEASTSSNFTYSPPNARTPGKADARVFVADVSVANPSEVCVYQLIGGGITKIAVACLPRPGYMPLPVVEERLGFATHAPKLGVRFTDDPTEASVTVWEDPSLYGEEPDPGHECKSLHQVMFCAKRRCLDPEGMVHEIGDPSTTPPGKAACSKWADNICLLGYNTAPQVVSLPYKTSTEFPGAYSFYGEAIEGLPNTQYPMSTPIVSKGNYEFVGGSSKTVDVSLAFPAWAYTPPKCYEYDAAGRCVNVDGTCVGTSADGQCIDYLNNQSSDPYAIDDSVHPPVQVLRPMEAEELGLCVFNPTDVWVKNSPGVHTYTVPQNCEELTVELWGAGGGGAFDNSSQRNTGNSGRNDESGGASGGFVKVVLPVGSGGVIQGGKNYNVTVGAGGVPCWTNTSDTTWANCAANSANSTGGSTIFAPTLTKATGGGWGRYDQGHGVPGVGDCGTGYSSCEVNDSTTAPDFSGNFGQWPQSCSANGPLKGGGSWDPSAGAYVDWPEWATQCDQPGNYDPDRYILDALGQFNAWAIWAGSSPTFDVWVTMRQIIVTYESWLNNRDNLKFPPYPGMGGCSASVAGAANCTSGGSDGYRAGPGAHGMARIHCSKDPTEVLDYPGGN